MVNNLEIEIKKYDKGYSFSSEENDKKRIYTIYSPELRQKVRKIISPYGIVGKGNIQYEGKNNQGDHIIYQQGKDDLPDKLTLISRGVIEEKEELKEIDEWDKMDAEFKAIEDDWRKAEAEWKKRETELGITMPTNYTKKHSWRSWNNDGSIGWEGMYIESENQSQLITFENKTNHPQIQEITDKEIENEKLSTSDKKEQKLELENKKKSSIQSDKNQEVVNNENQNFSLPIKIAVGSGTVLSGIIGVVVWRWKINKSKK